MPREFSRLDRVTDFLKQELAQLIRFEIKDPRLGTVNIVDAEVSRDMSHAKIYFTLIGSQNDADGAVAENLLNKASGFLRKHLSAVSTMRSTPQLHFYYDSSVARGGELSALIDKAVAEDKARHKDEIPLAPSFTKGDK